MKQKTTGTSTPSENISVGKNGPGETPKASIDFRDFNQGNFFKVRSEIGFHLRKILKEQWRKESSCEIKRHISRFIRQKEITQENILSCWHYENDGETKYETKIKYFHAQLYYLCAMRLDLTNYSEILNIQNLLQPPKNSKLLDPTKVLKPLKPIEIFKTINFQRALSEAWINLCYATYFIGLIDGHKEGSTKAKTNSDRASKGGNGKAIKTEKLKTYISARLEYPPDGGWLEEMNTVEIISACEKFKAFILSIEVDDETAKALIGDEIAISAGTYSRTIFLNNQSKALRRKAIK